MKRIKCLILLSTFAVFCVFVSSCTVTKPLGDVSKAAGSSSIGEGSSPSPGVQFGTVDSSGETDGVESSSTESNSEQTAENDGESVQLADIEPPMSESDLAYPLPDFLSNEQQLLLQRAQSIYCRLFGAETLRVEYIDDPDYVWEPYDTVLVNGDNYLISQGRYQAWEDFSALIFSTFTDGFWNALNNNTYIEYDEKLAFRDLGRGGSDSYNFYFPDEFELVKSSEREICFHVISHHSFMLQKRGETTAEYEARVKDGFEYTKTTQVTMVLTDNGWRFSDYSNLRVDDDRYEAPDNLTPSEILDTKIFIKDMGFVQAKVDDFQDLIVMETALQIRSIMNESEWQKITAEEAEMSGQIVRLWGDKSSVQFYIDTGVAEVVDDTWTYTYYLLPLDEMNAIYSEIAQYFGID